MVQAFDPYLEARAQEDRGEVTLIPPREFLIQGYVFAEKMGISRQELNAAIGRGEGQEVTSDMAFRAWRHLVLQKGPKPIDGYRLYVKANALGQDKKALDWMRTAEVKEAIGKICPNALQ